MIKVIEELIGEFRDCFSRQAAFYWFLIIIMGFLVRFDHLGVTSFVRWLFLRPECYELILHFFRSTSWNLDCLLQYWVALAVNHYPLIKFNDRPLLIGDGTKVSKA